MDVDGTKKMDLNLNKQPTKEKTNKKNIKLMEMENAGKTDEEENKGSNQDDDSVEAEDNASGLYNDVGRVTARAFFEKKVKASPNAILTQVGH
eukprot:15329115-Ditylum_brightwellii.AAC.2